MLAIQFTINIKYNVNNKFNVKYNVNTQRASRVALTLT